MAQSTDKLITKPKPIIHLTCNLQWDDKITTLPGLYLFTIGALNPLAHAYAGINGTAPALAMADLCSTAGLRAVNLCLSVLTLVVLNLLVAHGHDSKEKKWLENGLIYVWLHF